MSFKLKINAIRRVIMRGLTQHVGSSRNETISQNEIPNIKRILVSRPNNRLGNQILITPLVREVFEVFPNSKIDLFVRGRLAPILFEKYDCVDRIIRLPGKPFKELGNYIKVWFSLRKYRYDVVINVDSQSSSGRLSTQVAKARIKLFCEENVELEAQYADYIHMAKGPVYNFRKYALSADIPRNDKPIPTLDLKLDTSEWENGKRVLDEITKNRKRTIAIYTFATGEKCLSMDWWKETYRKLIAEFADEYNIVEVLPIENVSQIEFEAPSYYSRDIREMTAVIGHTDVFIGADSGIMHLASASGTSTVGLFSRDNIEQYKPYNGNSIALSTNTTNSDDLIAAVKQILID